MSRSICIALLICTGCAVVSPWKLDSIAAGDAAYSSARLVYEDSTRNVPFRLEFLRLGTAVDLFLTQTQYPIASQDPKTALVRFKIEGQLPFEEAIPLREGRMRLHLSEETASKITQALTEGQKVAITVDGYEETIEPERFSRLYAKLQGSAAFIRNPFKGPIE